MWGIKVLNKMAEEVQDIKLDVSEASMKIQFLDQRIGELEDSITANTNRLFEMIEGVQKNQTHILLTVIGALLAFLGTAFLTYFKPTMSSVNGTIERGIDISEKI